MTTHDAVDRATGAARTIQHGVDDAASTAQDAAQTAADAVPEVMARLRDGVEGVAERLPDALESARTGALATAGSLRAMPQPTLRVMAALSIGMGLGLYIAGAPRLVTLVAFSPALLVGVVATVDQTRTVTTSR